jgi:serine/threonine protein kinase
LGKWERTPGKVHFTAPEVLHGEPQTMASNIYSLGIIFWTIITAKDAMQLEQFQFPNSEGKILLQH